MGAVEVLEPTAAHPLYSLTRGDWVKAGELVTGELLQTRSGVAHVLSVTASAGAQRVFNFEVEGEHEYLVGGLEVRSHNASTCLSGKGPTPPDVPRTLENSQKRTPSQKMRDGEAAVNEQIGKSKNTTTYTDEAGKPRVPDFVEKIGPNGKPSQIVEAKNVKSQGYSDQIKAYEKMAERSGDPSAKIEIRMRSPNHPEGPTKPSRALIKASEKEGSIIKLLYTIDF